jgi:hypothetical protein
MQMTQSAEHETFSAGIPDAVDSGEHGKQLNTRARSGRFLAIPLPDLPKGRSRKYFGDSLNH